MLLMITIIIVGTTIAAYNHLLKGLLLLLLVLIVVAVLPVAAGILDFHLYEFCCQWFTGVSTIHFAMFEKTKPSVPCR